jgi:pimeloyl-ACP methyl ester carboxylesterase
MREQVRYQSKDGVEIGVFRGGTGTPLVLVHGTASDHARWNVVLAPLERRFTCYAMDRRGRGTSGDAQPYRIENEFDDIAAVVDGIGGPVDLLGHSYGGLCAMEAALRARNLRRLILYEPAAFIPGSSVYGNEVIERLERLLALGDREQLTLSMLRDVAGIPPATIEIVRRQPYWKTRLEVAPTIPRELHADKDYEIEPNRLRSIKVPTLLLLGGKSPAFYREGTEKIHQAIPNSRIHILEGQDHAAMDTGTRQFCDAVTNFLLEKP